MRYRKDIDGMRALAVVPVILFHAGVTPFWGGFIGVDIFFIISGYLITSLIVDEMRQGRFSIIRFYERRVRRIFPALLVWGDSHSDALIEMIGQVASRHSQSVKFLGNNGCPPVLGAGRKGIYIDCFKHNEQTLNYLLRETDLHAIIMVSRWSVYIEGYNRDFGPAEQRVMDPPWLTDEAGSVMNLREREELFSRQIRITIKKLIDAGKIVVLVYPIPETGYDIPVTLAKMVLIGRNPSQFTRPKSYYFRRHQFVSSVLDELGPADKIIRIRPDLRLCDGGNCIVYAQGEPLYRDNDHLSLAGADYLSDMFDPLFKPEVFSAASDSLSP